jgi:hypothetical protein
MKRILSLAVLALSFSAFAQVAVDTQSGAKAEASTAPIAIGTTINNNFPGSGGGAAGADGVQEVRYGGKQTVKTTGMAYMPGMAVASGGFNCGATGGAAVGGSGFSLGFGGAKSLDECVKLNLLNFAGLAGDNALYEAVWCTIPAGKAAYAEQGKECPSVVREQERARAQAAITGQAAPAGGVTASNTNDPFIRNRLTGN